MKRVAKFAKKIFNKPSSLVTGGGLYATLEELVEQKKYIPYLHSTKKKITSNQSGEIRSVFKGRGMEFEEIRPYTFGDDIRDIDWRVTARKLSPYTKLFAEEKDREIYVFLDMSPSMLFGTKKELKTVTVAKIAAMLGWVSLENKDRFGAVIYDGINTFVYKPQNTRNGLLVLLNKIAEVSQKILKNKNSSLNAETLNKSLFSLQNAVKGKAVVFVLSDFDDISDNMQKSISMLARRSSLICVNVLDVLEQNPPVSGEYMAESGGEKVVFDSSSRVFRADYRAYFQKQRNNFKIFCKKFSCQYIEIRTDLPLHTQLKDIY